MTHFENQLNSTRSWKYSNRKFLFIVVSILLFSVTYTSCKSKNDLGLKDAFDGKFLIGMAMNTPQITGKDLRANSLIVKHFNSIVAENCMKSEVIQPVEGEFNFTLSDQFVDFGVKNNMFIIGHTLVWHSQAPKWFFTDAKGLTVTREVLIERMHKHISTVVGRYKGRVQAWDVVNEAVNDDGTMRETPFLKIIGSDYLKLAYQFAHEADPDAELQYNDYSMAKPEKRNAVVKMVKELQAEGIKITAIGMQGHIGLDYPSESDFENSIEAFAALGIKIMITEMDITVLPEPQKNMGAEISINMNYDSIMNPYKNGLPDSVAGLLSDRYVAFFKLFLKHKDQISRVTLWGLTDSDSWRNGWPIRGRTDYPLLFDRNYKPKSFVETIMNEARK